MNLISQYYDNSIKLSEIKDLSEDELHYKLCYVSEIPVTHEDLSPETIEMYKTPEYKKYKELLHKWMEEQFKLKGSVSSFDIDRWESKNNYYRRFMATYSTYNTQEWLEGNTHYMFFTDDLDNQWGDDWDDAPYEHNAGWPYDFDTNVICVPFSIVYTHILRENEENDTVIDDVFNNFRNCVLNYPSSFGINSPFSVDMINRGAIPWIWLGKYDVRKLVESVAINGGDTVKQVADKVFKMNELIKQNA